MIQPSENPGKEIDDLMEAERTAHDLIMEAFPDAYINFSIDQWAFSVYRKGDSSEYIGDVRFADDCGVYTREEIEAQITLMKRDARCFKVKQPPEVTRDGRQGKAPSKTNGH